jgi:hypothetical protein
VLQAAVSNIENRISNNVFAVTGPAIATKMFQKMGREHEYFRDFEFWTQDELLPYMRLVGKLPYKQTPDHWVIAQRTRSIFAATEAEVASRLMSSETPAEESGALAESPLVKP